MKIRLATLCMYALSIVFFAWLFPMFYSLLFVKTVDKTHMFFSPVDNNMIYTEQILERDLKAEEKSENHHSDVVYKNEKDEYFTRNEFEAKIPFIYYRNMELRQLLPMQLHGKSFDSASIQKERRVLEMPSRLLDTKVYKEAVYPLIDANPGQVALVLPADRVRFTQNQLEFIDSDANGVDATKTAEYTKKLTDQGFTFPAQGVWGNFSTFKPFEGGIFVVDAKGKTFRLLRASNELEVLSMPFAAGIVPQKIVIAEAKDRKYLGLVLDTQDRMYLLHQSDFGLTHIPTPDFISSHMDFKLIMDPLFVTAVYSNESHIHAVAFANTEMLPPALSPLHSFTHKMSRSMDTTISTISSVLFPFSLSFQDMHSSIGQWKIQMSPNFMGLGLLFNALLALGYFVSYRKHGMQNVLIQSISIVALGIYIGIPFLLMEQYKARNSQIHAVSA